MKPAPEDAVDWDKRRNLSRLASQFLLCPPHVNAGSMFWQSKRAQA
jgi:hypothetical protein